MNLVISSLFFKCLKLFLLNFFSMLKKHSDGSTNVHVAEGLQCRLQTQTECVFRDKSNAFTVFASHKKHTTEVCAETCYAPSTNAFMWGKKKHTKKKGRKPRRIKSSIDENNKIKKRREVKVMQTTGCQQL